MIKPITLITKNVEQDISDVSKNYSIPSSKLYVEINSVTTFVKDGDAKYVEMYDEDFEEFQKEERLRDKTVEFEQECEVTILPKYQGYPFEALNSEIEFNKNFTRAYLVIKKGSKLLTTMSSIEIF